MTDDVWDELVKTANNNYDEIWKVNKAFIDENIRVGKEIILSNNPNVGYYFVDGNLRFYQREIDYLKKIRLLFYRNKRWFMESNKVIENYSFRGNIMNRLDISEAKELFLSSNCSKFEMWKEFPHKYQLYLNLKIDIELENKWREERLSEYFEEVKNLDENEKSWVIFVKMYELVEMIKNNDSLLIMENIINIICNNLNEKEKIIIAETIIGRRAREYRSGLIYISHDLGNDIETGLFANYSLNLLQDVTNDADLEERANNAKAICNNIMKELSI